MLRTQIACGVLSLAVIGTAAIAQDGGSTPIAMDAFENGLGSWTFVAGEEFPGAKGGLTTAASRGVGGTGAMALTADFTGGGAYVGATRPLTDLDGRDVRAFTFRAKAQGVDRIGVRLIDSTGQVHQLAGGLKLATSADWQDVRIDVTSVVGGEHWGGADDGKWHGPAKQIGLNVGKDGVPTQRGTLLVDDVAALPGAAITNEVTLLSVVMDPPVARPGYGSKITYRWKARPMGRDYGAFVHIIGPDGKTAMQQDHTPKGTTSVWSGDVEYSHSLAVPADTPPGDYRVVMGLYDGQAAKRNWDRPTLATGDGVKPATEANSYEVGVLKVRADAPLPVLTGPKLDLGDYKLTFADEFNDMSISEAGPGTRWSTATKETFSDAEFVPQKSNFPFTVNKGVLRIEARKVNGKWKSGSIVSVNPKGEGFSQQYGYFEMRAKFPKSEGMWPAFWLLGQKNLTDKSLVNPEIDIIEAYGKLPNVFIGTIHLWYPGGKHWDSGGLSAIVPGMSDDFHTYGVLLEEQKTAWYYDGVRLFEYDTPKEARVPMYMLVNLAMGGGWPIDKAVSPSYMYVDYVRAYARKSS